MSVLLKRVLLIVLAVVVVIALLLILVPGAREAFHAWDAASYEYMHGRPPHRLTWEERKPYLYLLIGQCGAVLMIGCAWLVGRLYCKSLAYYPPESRFVCTYCHRQKHFPAYPRGLLPCCPGCGKLMFIRPKPLPWWKARRRM